MFCAFVMRIVEIIRIKMLMDIELKKVENVVATACSGTCCGICLGRGKKIMINN
jgi:hypothetical protein